MREIIKIPTFKKAWYSPLKRSKTYFFLRGRWSIFRLLLTSITAWIHYEKFLFDYFLIEKGWIEGPTWRKLKKNFSMLEKISVKVDPTLNKDSGQTLKNFQNFIDGKYCLDKYLEANVEKKWDYYVNSGRNGRFKNVIFLKNRHFSLILIEFFQKIAIPLIFKILIDQIW